MTMLTLNNITLKFPQTNKPILNKINYQVSREDFIILLGSNGSGKSSLLKLLYRHYHSDEGKIHFNGHPITYYSNKDFNRHVGILTQNVSESLFMSLTIYENYLLIKKQKKLSTKNFYSERKFLINYLSDFNPNLSEKLNLTVQQLSGGEKQTLALALCLLQPPSLLLLDEHTSALDPKTSQQIMQLTQKMIDRYHITCILTTHDLDIAITYGNRILVLREGEIYQLIENEKKASLTKETLAVSCY